MAHGNPINSRTICSDTGGLEDLLKGGRKSILFLRIYNKKHA